MIIYNLRYRGPFEYDKMVLNAFQLSNEVDRMLERTGGEKMKTVRTTEKTLERCLEEYTKEDGFLEKLIFEGLRMK